MRIVRLSLAFLFLAGFAQAQEAKPLKIYLEGDSSMTAKMVQAMRDREKEYNVTLTFIDKQSEPYDLRVVLLAEGSGVWNYAQGTAVVLNNECKVLFAVMRSNRLTAKGAMNAVAKEIMKNMADYYGTRSKN